MPAVTEIEGAGGTRLVMSPAGAATIAPGQTGVDTQSVTVPSSAGQHELAGEQEYRRAVQIQNRSEADTLYVRLGDAAATSSDYAVGPGMTFMFPPNVVYREKIHGLASSGSVLAVVIQYIDQGHETNV